MPPPPAPSRWKWALVLSIPDGLVGTYFFGFHGLNQLQRLGYVSAGTAGAMVAAVILVCLGGLPLGVMGAGLGGLISWPLAKYAAHRWGLIGALLAGVLAGAIGGLLVAAGFLIFALI